MRKSTSDVTPRRVLAFPRFYESKRTFLTVIVAAISMGLVGCSVKEHISGKVLAVNSEWGFCVLNIGENQEAARGAIGTVYRNGKELGQVKLTSIEKSQAVADILAKTFAKDTHVKPGDDVVIVKDAKKAR